jgi:hypothetical protein
MAMADGFWLGVLGGVFAEIFSLSKLRYLPRDARPLWVGSMWYWAITVAMMLSGGALVAIYLGSGVTMTPLLAVNIGASAPLILQSLVSQAPPLDPSRVN